MQTSMLAAAVLLASFPALAEVYSAQDDFHFSLSRGVPTSALEGDLHVSVIGVHAAHGARRLSREEGGFQRREVLVLSEPYLIKDSAGETWRMWIRMSRNRDLEVELIRERARTEVVVSDLFRAVSVTIDDAEAKPTFADLALASDGTYRLGTAHGRYERSEAKVTLDGVPSQWGPGTLSVDGDGITFRYQRGQAKWEVKYARQDAAPAPTFAQREVE